MNREVLRIGMKEKGSTRIIRLSGELDSYTSHRLRGISEAWIPGAGRVIVNLDRLEYVDSSGLAALVRMWVTARNSGVEMVFACRNHRIRRILEITGLSNLFGTSVQAAKSAYVSAVNPAVVQSPTALETIPGISSPVTSIRSSPRDGSEIGRKAV